jgi:hypothetical protein
VLMSHPPGRHGTLRHTTATLAAAGAIPAARYGLFKSMGSRRAGGLVTRGTAITAEISRILLEIAADPLREARRSCGMIKTAEELITG